MVLTMVFTTFLSKVLVDALSGLETLVAEDFFIEVLVVDIITFGNGPEYLTNNLYILPIALVISALIAAGFSILRHVVRAHTTAVMNKDMQYRVFSHLERLPYSYYKTHKSGDLIQTCTRDIDVLRRFLMGDTAQLFYTFYVVLLCTGVLFSLSWKLTVVSLCFLPVMFVYSFFLIKKVRKLYRATDDAEALLTDDITENLHAVRIVKAYHNENLEIAKFDGLLASYKAKFVRWRIMSCFFFASSDILVFASKVAALLFGFYLAIVGEISPGTLYISFTFVNMMVWPLRDVATSLSNLGQYIASADRVCLVYDEPLEDIHSGKDIKIEGNIVFDHVGFHYEDDQMGVVNDVSFSVKKGQSVAIMGKTGSGKSTIVSLLTRLYDVSSGAIYVDGTNINEISKTCLRRQIVPVLQDPFLFTRNLRENIRIAYPYAKDEEVIEAARIASLDETIKSFERGYDTPVGERGATLSGGQRQRVAIARSLIGKSPVIVFDDSLSAVDTETDLRIRKNLREKMKDSTTFIITHRVSSAKDCDLIIVLDEGKVAEIGTHEELSKGGGPYSRIAEIQGRM